MTERMKNLHTLLHNTSRSCTRLQEKIAKAMHSQSIELGDTLSADMKSLMEEHSAEVLSSCDEDSFKATFWKQQMKAISLKNKRSMRWHPLVIKWCLYLHHRSSSAYETLRNSGLIELPSGRTLRDYRHAVPSSVGFSSRVDEQLIRFVRQTKPSPSLAKYVGILIDEMYVKEGLTFDNWCTHGIRTTG